MEKTLHLYQVFKGWYRKSLARKNGVWHRVHQVDSVVDGKQMAHTVCGRSIPTTHCDFVMKPGSKCVQCGKPSGIVIETGRGFVPVGSISIPTKTAAITELKRLLKSRTYYVRIWGNKGIRIAVEWISAMDIDVSIYPETMVGRRKNKIMTLEQIQADLGRFKSAIDCLCDKTTALAIDDKRKNKIKGRLTEYEDQMYFETLLHEAEK